MLYQDFRVIKMKKFTPILIFTVIVAGIVMGTTDMRHYDARFPVALYEVSQLTVTADTSTADSDTINVNGIIEQIEVIINDVNSSVTFTVAIVSADSGTLFSVASIAENSTTVLKATSDSSDFDAFLAAGVLTVTATPSGDCNDVGATIDINLYAR
jgi:hypothetical protein